MTGIDASTKGVFGFGPFLFDKNFTLFEKFYPLPMPTYPPTQPTCDWYAASVTMPSADIACEGETGTKETICWVALKQAVNGVVLRRYSAKSQAMALEPETSFQATLTDSIKGSIGIGNSIEGLAYEKGAHRFLWASNNVTNTIYKIDLDTPTSIGNNITLKAGRVVAHRLQSGGYILSFNRAVTAEAIVYDSQGRRVAEFAMNQPSNRIKISNDGLSAGIYFVKLIRDGISVQIVALTITGSK